MLLIATARMAVASVAATSIVAVVAEPAVVTRKAERLTVETRRRSVSAAALADVVADSVEDVELVVVVEARAISRAESISSRTPREAKMEEREAVVAVAEDVEEEAEEAADAERASPPVPVESPRLRDLRSKFCLTDSPIHCNHK